MSDYQRPSGLNMMDDESAGTEINRISKNAAQVPFFSFDRNFEENNTNQQYNVFNDGADHVD